MTRSTLRLPPSTVSEVSYDPGPPPPVAVLTDSWSAHEAALGVSVSHTPSAVDHGTATTALYLLLGAFRQYAHGEINARKGEYLASGRSLTTD
jgi:hypothetical protein